MRERQSARMKGCTVTSSEGVSPSISRALNQDVTSGEELPGRRNGRSSGQDCSRSVDWPRIVQKGRGLENESGRCEREFEFFEIRSEEHTSELQSRQYI